MALVARIDSWKKCGCWLNQVTRHVARDCDFAEVNVETFGQDLVAQHEKHVLQLKDVHGSELRELQQKYSKETKVLS